MCYNKINVFLNKVFIRLYQHAFSSAITFDLKIYILRQNIPGQLLFLFWHKMKKGFVISIPVV